jgi:hypothetical protein
MRQRRPKRREHLAFTLVWVTFIGLAVVGALAASISYHSGSYLSTVACLVVAGIGVAGLVDHEWMQR